MNKNIQKIYFRLPSIVKDSILSYSLFKQRKVRYGNFYTAYLNIYRQNITKGEKEIQTYQLSQLKKLLLESIEYCDYYKTSFAEKDVSKDFIQHSNSIEEIFTKIPLLPKENLKKYNLELQNKKRSSDYKNFTSGTSGTPNLIIYDQESLQIGFALWRRFHDTIGLPEKFKSVRLSGKILINPSQNKKPFWVMNLFDKQLFMSTYHLSEENMHDYVNKLNRLKPEFIDAYPSALYILSQFINKHNLKLEFIPFAISTTAETLYEHYKVEIEKAFQCKVYNQYSSSEGGPFITECQNGKLHLNTDSGVFEFINIDNKPAEAGEYAELCVTSLRQWKTPLIRYKTGDWVKVSSKSFTYQNCACGSCMPVVDEIVGRQEDILFTPEKGYVGRMDPAYKGLTGIVKSKIIQHSENSLEVQNVVDSNYSNAIEKQLIYNIRERLGEKIEIVVNLMDEIPLGPSGKFKAVERKFKI